MPPESTGSSLLRLGAAMLLCGMAANLAWAEEEDRALQGFARPAPAAVRKAPVLPLEWERSLLAPDRFGPPLLRAGDAALLAAARQSRWTEVLELLKSGRSGANAQDDIHGNALVMAARAGREDVVRDLLRRGANSERLGEDGFTPLGIAAFAGHRAIVRVLLRAGADPVRMGATGQTALHLAAVTGRTDVMQALLQARVDIEVLNSQRETALDVAAGAGQQDAMDLLIKAGADLQRAGRR